MRDDENAVEEIAEAEEGQLIMTSANLIQYDLLMILSRVRYLHKPMISSSLKWNYISLKMIAN